MSHAALVEAVRAASPEERRSLLAELVQMVLAESAAPVVVADAAGRVVARLVPDEPPPPITQADIDELDRRIARRHRGGIDARELLAEYERMANQTE